MTKILAANRLRDGVAVWFAADGGWAENVDAALVARDGAAARTLEEAGEAATAANLVIGAEIVDVEETAGKLRPARLRERIRAHGPTVRYRPDDHPPTTGA